MCEVHFNITENWAFLSKYGMKPSHPSYMLHRHHWQTLSEIQSKWINHCGGSTLTLTFNGSSPVPLGFSWLMVGTYQTTTKAKLSFEGTEESLSIEFGGERHIFGGESVLKRQQRGWQRENTKSNRGSSTRWTYWWWRKKFEKGYLASSAGVDECEEQFFAWVCDTEASPLVLLKCRRSIDNEAVITNHINDPNKPKLAFNLTFDISGPLFPGALFDLRF